MCIKVQVNISSMLNIDNLVGIVTNTKEVTLNSPTLMIPWLFPIAVRNASSKMVIP